MTSIIFSKNVQNMKVKFGITTRLEIIFDCLKATHAHDFLLVISTDEFSQHMPMVEYRIILRYHLMIPLFFVGEVCHIYHKACLDTFEKHIV